MSESVRDALRHSTHSHHVRINRHPLLGQLTRPGLSRSTYARILAAYRSYFRVIEPAIERFLSSCPGQFDYTPRRKLPWLECDLTRFEAPVRAVDITDQLRTLSRISEPGEAIGVLYAIEGSTLGGQVIARHLAQNLGIDRATGARYFSGYGLETESRWQEFCRFAESIVASDRQIELARSSAIQAFIATEQCLDL
jgi:heme oxygenase (biliverdin-IX-beta and delta-forming)